MREKRKGKVGDMKCCVSLGGFGASLVYQLLNFLRDQLA